MTEEEQDISAGNSEIPPGCIVKASIITDRNEKQALSARNVVGSNRRTCQAVSWTWVGLAMRRRKGQLVGA
jgi:hypothetical protein